MTIKKTLSLILLALVLVAPVFMASYEVAYAAPGDVTTTKTGDQATGLQDPLKVGSLAEFFYMIANFAYSLSYAVIAFFLIWSGFKFIVAQGNEEKLSDAKKTFYYTIIGAVLLIGANVITEVVRAVIGQFSKTPL